MGRILNSLSIIISFIVFSTSCGAQRISSEPLFLEVHTKGGIKQVVVQPNEIVRAGIDERGVEPSIGITIARKHHELLEKLTKENIGQKMVIRTENETVFSGTIMEGISMGKLGFSCRSVEEAEAVFNKMGREPDYHLKLTPEELEAGKGYMEPYHKNPWAKKAFDLLGRKQYPDYDKAEGFAKKAIESDPNEGEYHFLLGLIYYQQGRKRLALEEYLTGERLSSEGYLSRSPGRYLDIAGLYAELEKYDKATEYLNRILTNNKENLLARSRLAEVYEKMGKYNLAIEEYSLLSKSDDETFRKFGMEGIERLKNKDRGSANQ